MDIRKKKKKRIIKCWSKIREIHGPEFFSKEGFAKHSSGMVQVHMTLI